MVGVGRWALMMSAAAAAGVAIMMFDGLREFRRIRQWFWCDGETVRLLARHRRKGADTIWEAQRLWIVRFNMVSPAGVTVGMGGTRADGELGSKGMQDLHSVSNAIARWLWEMVGDDHGGW